MRLILVPGARKVSRRLLIFGTLLRQGFGQGPGERTPMETWDDRLLQVEKRVAGFGGMFIGEDGRLMVYLLDPSKIMAARAAIVAVFGNSQVPEAGIGAVRGRYTMSQLKRWSARANKVLEIPGVVMVDLDEGRNRVTIGLEEESQITSIEKKLSSLRIPPEAVVVEVKGKIVPLAGRSSKGSPK